LDITTVLSSIYLLLSREKKVGKKEGEKGVRTIILFIFISLYRVEKERNK